MYWKRVNGEQWESDSKKKKKKKKKAQQKKSQVGSDSEGCPVSAEVQRGVKSPVQASSRAVTYNQVKHDPKPTELELNALSCHITSLIWALLNSLETETQKKSDLH